MIQIQRQVRRGYTHAAATLLGVVALIASTSTANAQVTKVTAKGQSAIYLNDVANARDKALADAFRKAVEQAIGAMVSSETVVENYQLISDKILTRARGFVKTYNVISEGEIEEGLYQVEIEAQVASAALNTEVDQVLAVLEAKNMPRVLMMISEQNVGGKSSGWWNQDGRSISLDIVDNTVIDLWQAKGFKFVDRQILEGKLRAGGAMTGDPSNDIAKEFGQLSGAEVVVVGKAVAHDQGPVVIGGEAQQMRSFRAEISLRALNVDNGAILATVTASAVTGHIDAIAGGTLALKQVAKQVAGELLTKLLDNWVKEIGGPSTISLTLTNVKKSKFLRQIASFLRNQVRGIQDVRQRTFKRKVASLEVSLKGTSQDLAEELEEKSFPRFDVEIEEITANTVTANLVPKTKK